MSTGSGSLSLSYAAASSENVPGVSWFLKMEAPNKGETITPPKDLKPGPYDKCLYIFDPTANAHDDADCPCPIGAYQDCTFEPGTGVRSRHY